MEVVHEPDGLEAQALVEVDNPAVDVAVEERQLVAGASGRGHGGAYDRTREALPADRRRGALSVVG